MAQRTRLELSDTMLVDTKGLTRELEGKTIRVCFSDGTAQVVTLEFVMIFDCHNSCNGFVYKLLPTNRPELFEKVKRESPNGFSCWGNFEDILSWQLVEDGKFE